MQFPKANVNCLGKAALKILMTGSLFGVGIANADMVALIDDVSGENSGWIAESSVDGAIQSVAITHGSTTSVVIDLVADIKDPAGFSIEFRQIEIKEDFREESFFFINGDYYNFTGTDWNGVKFDSVDGFGRAIEFDDHPDRIHYHQLVCAECLKPADPFAADGLYNPENRYPFMSNLPLTNPSYQDPYCGFGIKEIDICGADGELISGDGDPETGVGTFLRQRLHIKNAELDFEDIEPEPQEPSDKDLRGLSKSERRALIRKYKMAKKAWEQRKEEAEEGNKIAPASFTYRMTPNPASCELFEGGTDLTRS